MHSFDSKEHKLQSNPQTFMKTNFKKLGAFIVKCKNITHYIFNEMFDWTVAGSKSITDTWTSGVGGGGGGGRE